MSTLPPPAATLSRDDLASRYLDQLPFVPYPVQEEALLTWFTTTEGVLVCAPTGTGKTVIAEAALFEALHTGAKAYYTTPLIALTEQKFREMQDAAERWGFSRDDVGLVTGNRRVNPDARILVVVAEILLNRLLSRESGTSEEASGPDPFENVTAVVMDEFHSFNDVERGMVWELSLALLPSNVRLLLLSATVGNSAEFLIWLQRSHGRRLDFVQSTDRKIPLTFEWVGEQLLNEQLEAMCQGIGDARRTPALLFCFNRAECWTVAEQLKGKDMLADGQQQQLVELIDQWDWKVGVGPKLRSILLRGVGVHHAGLLPKYRRRVEELFQRKLLSVCVCTETLAAGINLPARSVVMTSLVKGPPGKKTLIDASTAHQIFGRAGRPQFDTQGFVFVLAHEDDVRIGRWKKQYEQIPEDTKDPNLLRAKKALKKKMPTRRAGEQYWNEPQFQKLIQAPPVKLASRGELPWRLLAYLLKLSPDVTRLKRFVRKRLLDAAGLKKAEERLTQMLLTLHNGGYVRLEPTPPEGLLKREEPPVLAVVGESVVTDGDFGGDLLDSPVPVPTSEPGPVLKTSATGAVPDWVKTLLPKQVQLAATAPPPAYDPQRAVPLPALDRLMVFRSVSPLYGDFLVRLLGQADTIERMQALESVLELSASVWSQVRVPPPEELWSREETVAESDNTLRSGPLARNYLDAELLRRGLATPADLNPKLAEEEQERTPKLSGERTFRPRALTLADKLRRLFDAEFPHAGDLRTAPVWALGDLLSMGGDFHKYVTSRDLTKQEGLIFRHALRMILLCGEFSQTTPPDHPAAEWQSWLQSTADTLTIACRAVDPDSTDEILETLRAANVMI